jgi:Family of unknown function (DUF6247)
MASPLGEVPFTELIQHPTRTTERLGGGRALRLRRRDADDLVLMSAARAEQEHEVVDLTARLLAGVLAERVGVELVRQALPAALPWVRFLPAAAIDEFAAEFAATVNAASSLYTVVPVSQLLTQWRHTAEVYADPELHAILSQPHEDDYGPVLAPDAAA